MNDATGPRDGDRPRPEGPPSAYARDALSADLRREVADARLRFQEAGMRAETHRLLGDDEGAAEVLREQEQILADVQARLGRVVSSAVLQRDAEQVLADAAATTTPTPPTPVLARDVLPDAPDRPRTPALAGVASVVALLAVTSAAMFGVVRGFPPVEISEVAADVTPDEAVDRPAPTAEAPRAGPPAPIDPLPGRPTATGTPDDAASTPDAPSPSDTPSTTGAPTEAPTPDPTDEPELAAVVQELVDAVAGLGGPDDAPSDAETPSEDVDTSADELGTLLDQLGSDDARDAADGDAVDGDAAEGGTDGDGFVPGAPAE